MRTAKQTAEAAGSNPAPPSTGAYAGSYLLFLFSDSRERPARSGRNPATRAEGAIYRLPGINRMDVAPMITGEINRRRGPVRPYEDG